MQVVQDDLWFCDDCTMAVCNGDLPQDDSREEDVLDGLERFGPHIVPDFDSESGDGILEFAHKNCCSCGEGPGSFHRFAVLGEDDDA